ncbi:MAG: glutamate formimidoyltransferase [Planctomycetes bacterium]|nr:glutamate formimidoyltransferase [Planctomycetota bacterium]
MTRIVECVPNFSEGRRPEVLRGIVGSMGVDGVAVLDEEMDGSHNRAVVSLAGEPAAVARAAFEGVAAASRAIDLRGHKGEHPRMGACDVLPFVPVRGVEMADCVALAKEVGARIGEELGIPVFLYGEAATRPERAELPFVRNKQFEGLLTLVGTDPAFAPDFGPPRMHPSAGGVSVGARFFLIAYNVNLRTPDVAVAKEIAKRVREKDGGLPRVKALGFFLAERALSQVSMNLTDYRVTSILRAYEAVERHARERGVEVVESEIVGLVPRAALFDGIEARIRLAGFDRGRQVVEDRLGIPP